MDGDGAGHAFQLDLTGMFGDNGVAQSGYHPLGGQHLAALCLAAQAGGEVHHRADGRVLEATLEADLAAGREAGGDAHSESQVVPATLPLVGQPLGAVAHGQAKGHSASFGLLAGDRVVEEDHHSVAGELRECPALLEDDRTDRVVHLLQHRHDILGLGSLGKGRESAQVAEQHGYLGAMTLQHRCASGGHRLHQLRRHEASHHAESFDLLHLLGDALFEFGVPGGNLGEQVALDIP